MGYEQLQLGDLLEIRNRVDLFGVIVTHEVIYCMFAVYGAVIFDLQGFGVNFFVRSCGIDKTAIDFDNLWLF